MNPPKKTQSDYKTSGSAAPSTSLSNNLEPRRLPKMLPPQVEYQAIVEAIDHFICVISPNYELEYINPACIEYLGCNPVGRKCYRALYGLRRICPWCENNRVLRGESVYREFLSPNDNRWYATTSSPMYNGDGSISSVALIQEITARKLAEEQSIILAYHDSLTGLPNRNLFSDRLDQALNRAKRNGYLVAVMILDLDYFKTCNDTLGHAGGDFVLKAVAQRLCSVLRKDDTVARLSGDEFAIIAAGSSGLQEVATVAQKILDLFRQPFFCQEKEVWMTTSIGIAFFPLEAEDAETLVNNADEAMYAAKAAGRNNYQFFSEKLCRPLRSPVT